MTTASHTDVFFLRCSLMYWKWHKIWHTKFSASSCLYIIFFFFYYICNLHLFIWKADVILCPCHGGEVLLWNANEALIERYSWKGRSVRQWSRRSRVPGGALSAAIWSRVMYHWTTTRAARGCSRTHAVRIVTSVALTTFTSRRTCCFLAPFNPSLRKIHDFFVCVTRGHCGVLR